jgi:hypothetical protein
MLGTRQHRPTDGDDWREQFGPMPPAEALAWVYSSGEG